MAQVLAVCISEKRGTPKTNVGRGEFRVNHGIVGDAHAGAWHRQVSLLSHEKIEAFRQRGVDTAPGDFGENLVVAGIDFSALPVGTVLECGAAVLEITQIGKECHNHCAIFQAVGDCIMPREGIFARVIRGGPITVGDQMRIQAPSK
jgi:MOSC domain-containing protein YiiM